jgi:hypothetical protein
MLINEEVAGLLWEHLGIGFWGPQRQATITTLQLNEISGGVVLQTKET